MQKGTLFIAPPGARHKKDLLFNKIVTDCPDGNYSSVLYAGPNPFTLSTAGTLFHSYLKTRGGMSAYVPFQSTTLKQLASFLHEQYGSGTELCDHLKTLVLYELGNEKNIGYARILSDLRKKLFHYIPHETTETTRDRVCRLIAEEKTAEKAGRAFDALLMYEKEMGPNTLLAPEDILRSAIPLIREHVSPAILAIDGFYDPTPLEMEMLGGLISKAGKVYLLTETGTEIHDYVLSLKPDLEITKLDGTPVRATAGFYSFPSMEEEVEGIARSVKKLIIEGMNPWDITVCFPALSRYLPVLTRVFKSHGVPLSIGELNISGSAPFTALGEMITCIEEDYPRNDFLSFLTSPFFPAVPSIVKERAVSYSYRAGIVKGRDSWLSIGDIIINSLGEDLSEDEEKSVDEFRKGIELVAGIIEDIKNRTDIISFADAFESALTALGFFDSPALTHADGQGRNISDVITRQLSLLRDFAVIYGGDRGNAEPPAFYMRYLLQGITGSEENREGVKILPYELAAGLESRALFCGGVIEGDFPSRPEIDPILPERVKKDLGMPYLEYLLKRQKSYFRRLLAASSREPWFSCPSAEGEKVLLPSPFLDWDKSMPPPELNIFTEEDVQIMEGKYMYADGEAFIFWGKDMFADRESFHRVRQKAGKQFNGFISVTAIDYYRKCPLRFYIERVLGLEAESPPRFEVEARLWGTLAHKTMEYLFKDGDIDLNNMDNHLFQGLEKSLRQFPVGDFWSKVAREIFQRLLPLLREQETEIRVQGFSPFIAEKKLTAEINGLRLKGKIDRVDIKKGQGTGVSRHEKIPNSVLLLDYKTGAADRDSLQLPLYASMWRENFPESVERAGNYSLKEGRVEWLPKNREMKDYMEDALRDAAALVENLKKGIFAPVPVKDTECRYCYHSPLCSKECRSD